MKPRLYTLRYQKMVAKDLRGIHQVQRVKIMDKIKALAANPCPIGAIKLHGGLNLYRIRSGNYRIIYRVEHEEVLIIIIIIIIIIVKIGHRKNVYEKF